MNYISIKLLKTRNKIEKRTFKSHFGDLGWVLGEAPGLGLKIRGRLLTSGKEMLVLWAAKLSLVDGAVNLLWLSISGRSVT